MRGTVCLLLSLAHAVRRELEKAEQTADMAVAKVQDEAKALRATQTQVQTQSAAATEFVEAVQRDVTSATTALERDVARLDAQLGALDTKVQQQGVQSIDEDFLMTQLTVLQERQETELTQCRDACKADAQTAADALAALQRQVDSVAATSTETTAAVSNVTAALERAQDDAQRTRNADDEAHAAAIAALTAQVDALTRRLHDVEAHVVTDTRAHVTRAIDELEHRSARSLHDVELRLERKLDAAVAMRDAAPQMNARYDHEPPPPPQYHVVPRESDELLAMRNQLHRMGRDVHTLADDLHRFTQRIDARYDELHDRLSAQVRDLRTELFDALSYDSRLHVSENTRLRDRIDASHRDLRVDLDAHVRDVVELALRDVRENVGRIDETLRRRSRSRSPPHRRPFSSRRERPPFFREPSPPVPTYVGPPQRSRSRSRSNPRTFDRRSPWRREEHRSRSPPVRPDTARASNALPTSVSRGPSPEPDRPRAAPVSPSSAVSAGTTAPTAAAASASNGVSEPPSTGATVATQPAAPAPREQPSSPLLFRRTKRPRKAHEVIVIEDDDEDDVDAAVAPNRAPLDVVREDADTRPRTIVVCDLADDDTDDDDGDTDTASVSDRLVADRVRSLADVRLGALLYFCYSGAPSLDVEWTHFCSALSDSDCIDMARVTRFLQLYPALHAFPIYLAQFLVQAVVVKVPASDAQWLAPADPSASRALDKVTPAFVHGTFDGVLDRIRRLWAEKLTTKLETLLERTAASATGAPRIAMNPSLVTSASSNRASAAAAQTAWQLAQAQSLWVLLRQIRFGATLPPFRGDMVASPGVYVFLLLFDPVHVERLSPQRASFRLTNWGRAVVIQLWDHLVSTLPYLLFADCAWLEKQTDTGGKVPPLGLCHLLSAVLAWNSLDDHALATSAAFHRNVVRALVQCLYVNGTCVSEHATLATVSLDPATEIALVGVDTALVSLLELDGFFEVAHAIVTHARAAIAAPAPAKATTAPVSTPASAPVAQKPVPGPSSTNSSIETGASAVAT